MLPLLAVLGSLFYLIPRGSGSRAHAKRVSASHINPLSRLNHTVSGDSTFIFLSAVSPGFFLDLHVPRYTSLVKVYGHKRADASLYGVHLAYDGKGLQIVDGHDPSIPALLDDQPSCIFSLSIDPRKELSLELYNLYDRRFRGYGTITFAFAEYIPRDEASDAHVHMCRHHIDSFSPASALLPRDGNASIPTQPPAIGEKSNIIIGLLAALIIIVLAIFILAAIYVLRIRHRAVRRRASRDLVLKYEENQNHPLDITSASFAATETLQPRSQDQVYKDQYIQQPRSAVYTDPTSLTSRTDIAKQISTSRHHPRNNPPTSPPKEPIPEVPKLPFPPPALQVVRSNGEVSQKSPTPPSTQYPGSMNFQDSWPSSGATTYPTSRTNDVLSPLRRAEPAQVHKPDNSTSRDVPSRPKGHPHSRFSKPLPELLPDIKPLSLSPPSHAIVHSPQNSGPSNDPPGYIDICKQHTGVHDEVQTAREPSTTHMGIDDSNQPSVHSAHKHTRSLDNEARSLYQNPSKTNLEHSATITASGWRDTAISQDRGRPKRSAQSSQHIHTRVPRTTQPDNAVKKASLDVPLLDDPEEWLLYLQHQEEFVEPVKNTDKDQLETRRVMPLRISEADVSIRRARRSARVEINQQRANKNKPSSTVTQHQEATSSLEQDTPTQVHSPRRALPKPPS